MGAHCSKLQHQQLLLKLQLCIRSPWLLPSEHFYLLKCLIDSCCTAQGLLLSTTLLLNVVQHIHLCMSKHICKQYDHCSLITTQLRSAMW
jgi:hypothetical protein